MMVSTKGRYALMILTDLAVHAKDDYVSLADVGERQGISLKYLEAIVASLNKAGYVESRRGKSGGYKLARSPKDCTVGGALKAAEGSLAPVSCLENCADECRYSAKCLTLPVWRELDRRIDEYLESITIEDVLAGKVVKKGETNGR
jgi:Rrf2 family protein